MLRNYLEVVVEPSAKGGLLLSSSGFTTNVFRGITEVARRRVRLGDREKIIRLCQSYLRHGPELLLKGSPLPQLLFEKTLSSRGAESLLVASASRDASRGYTSQTESACCPSWSSSAMFRASRRR